MNRARSPATKDSQAAARRPWRVVFGDGGDGPGPSAGIASLDGPANMAVDAALLASVRAGGGPVLRLYRWDPACLSFGRNQPAKGRYDAAAAAARGIDLVRRPTGGQAVLHDDELTYAVIAPVAVIGKPRAAYGSINRALVDGLRRLGVQAVLAEGGGLRSGDRSAARPPSGPDWDAACFRRPQRGEVVAGGAKLVGSAQRVEGRTILQHGSILLGGSQAAAEELLLPSARPVGTSDSRRAAGRGSGTSTVADPDASPGSGAAVAAAPGWTTLERELARRPSLLDLAEAVTSGFSAALGVVFESALLSAAEREAVEERRAAFASDEWTWRR